jgi:hypothetical protein
VERSSKVFHAGDNLIILNMERLYNIPLLVENLRINSKNRAISSLA